MRRRPRTLLRIVALWWVSGFAVCSVAGLAYLTLGRLAFMGAGQLQWAHTVTAMGLSFLGTGSLQLLGLSVLGGLGQWLASGPQDRTVAHDALVAMFLLWCFNAWLLVGHPGGLPLVPVLSRLPVAIELLVIVAAPLVAIPILLRRQDSRIRVLALIAIPIVLVSIPHRGLRWFFEAAQPRETAASPKVMVLAVDELGWRPFLEATQDLCGPLGMLDAAVPGLSHYGSTRKEWRLLLTGDSAGVERELFVPPLATRTTPESRLLLVARQRQWRVTFAIDNAITASEQSLRVDFLRFVAPQAGAADLLRMQIGRTVPMMGWLANVMGPIEAQNPYSRLRDLLRDFESELDRTDLALFHTTYLANDLTSYAEMRALEGPSWMWKRGMQFRLRGNESRCPDGECADAQALYMIKARVLMSVLLPWAEDLVQRGRVTSGLIFADHGQDFLEAPAGEVHTAGYHGWYMSSDVLRVPFIPLGTTRITGTGSATSWLEVGSALDQLIRGESQTLEIARVATPRTVRSHFIRPTGAAPNVEEPDPAVLTSQLIAQGVDFGLLGGWFLSPSPRWATAPLSVATITGDVMRISNPERVGRVPMEIVDSAQVRPRRSPTSCSAANLNSR